MKETHQLGDKHYSHVPYLNYYVVLGRSHINNSHHMTHFLIEFQHKQIFTADGVTVKVFVCADCGSVII